MEKAGHSSDVKTRETGNGEEFTETSKISDCYDFCHIFTIILSLFFYVGYPGGRPCEGFS